MSNPDRAVAAGWNDVVLLDGIRTPFVDYNGALAAVSPIDLGIKVGRAVLAKASVPAAEVGTVVCGSMAQASFDAYMLPRHIGLYSGVPQESPAHMVQRVCGTGIEVLSQAADAVSLGRAELALCVGTESMSRNPVAAYTHRGGFKMGQIEFKDFLWEALLDPAADVTMGQTAENLARQYQIRREDVDAFAAQSQDRALAAQQSGFLAGEIVPVASETFTRDDLHPRGIRLKKDEVAAADTHIRYSPGEVLAKLKPVFGGVQTGGNSSAIVDGAAAALVASKDYARQRGLTPLSRIVGCVAVGVDPRVMGIGPAPAIRALCERAGVRLANIDRIEINEAFGAQAIACCRELRLDMDKVNVNGGAIAIGHPLAATGIRLAVTVSRELKRAGLRYGVASACIGGGQGIAMMLENTEADAAGSRP